MDVHARVPVCVRYLCNVLMHGEISMVMDSLTELLWLGIAE